ncbi:MAG: type VII toxin-antitoxin system MntA family adenylyltransferase antitoxin [Longimicrobiales bacterium]
MIRRPSPPGLDHAALDECCARLGLRMVVLFGSRATGSPPPQSDSDLDLAIAFVNGQRREFWDCHDALAELFPGQSLDLVFLSDADPLFRWEILSEGVLLWGDVDDFLEMRAFAYRDFHDSADLRALERTLSMKKLAHIRQQLGSPS